MANKEEFVALYNRLDSLARQRFNLDDRSESSIMLLINELRHSNYYRYQDLGDDLDSVRNLRNALIHCPQVGGEDLFSVNSNAIETLNQIINVLDNPPKALAYALSIKQLYVTHLEDKVLPVVHMMAEKGYSHVPVLDNESHLLGVFSEGALFSYLSQHSSISLTNDEVVASFIDFLPIDKHENEQYLFVDRNALLEEVIKAFETSKKKYGKRLGMVFITEHGKSSEKIMGALSLGNLLIA